jgi:hypothetical protein
LGVAYNQGEYGVPRLKILKKNQSVKYTVKAIIPTNAVDSLKGFEEYEVNFDARYWVYSDALLRFTYTSEDPRHEKVDPNGVFVFAMNSRVEYSKGLDIYIMKDYGVLDIER